MGHKSMLYVVLKRLLDVVVALATLTLLLPVFAVIAVAIVVTDGRPIFYFQNRVGCAGRKFRFIKFRTMRRDADALLKSLAAQNEAGGTIFKMKHDPRVTPVGRWLRRFSMDELPQLIHVLTGDMTLVGPRPPRTEEVAGREAPPTGPESHSRPMHPTELTRVAAPWRTIGPRPPQRK